MTNKILLAFICALSLSFVSCGKLEGTRKKEEPLKEPETRLTEEQFRAQCLNKKNGRLERDGTLCLTRVIKSLDPYDALNGAAYVQITDRFLQGMFIVATGKGNGNVDVLYDHSTLPGLTIPGRLMPMLRSPGKALGFYVNGSNYKDVSVTIWTCHDTAYDKNDPEKNMIPVICPPEYIPQS